VIVPRASASTAGSRVHGELARQVFSQHLLSDNRNSRYNLAMTTPIDKPPATMAQKAAARPSAQIVRRHNDLPPPPAAIRKNRLAVGASH
jgi:hypothetical protein